VQGELLSRARSGDDVAKEAVASGLSRLGCSRSWSVPIIGSYRRTATGSWDPPPTSLSSIMRLPRKWRRLRSTWIQQPILSEPLCFYPLHHAYRDQRAPSSAAGLPQ